MSTLTLRYLCPIHYTSPRPLKFSSVWTTRPQAPRVGQKEKKTVIDTFPKWLDAYMTYMLVLVNAYPRRALKLIKYQQIISRAVAKFKGLAWLSYDQLFCRRTAYDLSLSWDKLDFELWTVTLAGLAKPHCNVCSSPYHAEDVCPSADLNRKSCCPPDCVLRLQQVLWLPAPKLQLPPRVPSLLFQHPHRPGMHPATAQQRQQGPKTERPQQEVKWSSNGIITSL